MRFFVPSFLACFLLSALGGMALQAHAQSPRDKGLAQRMPAPQRAEAVRQRDSSLSDAVRRAQRETGGQVLGAERIQFDGREINRVKVMDDRGRVRYMDDDPQRGRGAAERRRDLLPPAPHARGDNPDQP